MSPDEKLVTLNVVLVKKTWDCQLGQNPKFFQKVHLRASLRREGEEEEHKEEENGDSEGRTSCWLFSSCHNCRFIFLDNTNI